MAEDAGTILEDSNGKMITARCMVCNSADVTMFIELSRQPIHCNQLCSTRMEALNAAFGDVKLGYCSICSHVFNLAFKPELMAYDANYENSLHFSPRFQTYAESIVKRLVEKYRLHDKDIIEIGCGQGEFLKILCKLGHNRGLGFDRSYTPVKKNGESQSQVTFIRDYYTQRYAHCKADFVCCRHVLEHIHPPRDFLRALRSTIGNRTETVVFFEVPNLLFMIRDISIWDIIYEHCAYYSELSLIRLFSECGFNVLSITEEFEGQFLGIEAVPGDDLTSKHVADHERGRDTVVTKQGIGQNIEKFPKMYQSKIDDCRTKLQAAGGRIVVWGAGSKGVTFLNTLQIKDEIEYVVDLNPRKHGMYITGTGQKIITPEMLLEYQPSSVLVMNPIYKPEIRKILDEFGLDTDLI